MRKLLIAAVLTSTVVAPFKVRALPEPLPYSLAVEGHQSVGSEILRERRVGKSTYQLTKGNLSLRRQIPVPSKKEKAPANGIELVSVEQRWQEEFTDQARCGEFFRYVSADGKQLDAGIVVFANGEVKIYLFGEHNVTAHSYKNPFQTSEQCGIRLSVNATGTTIIITNGQGQSSYNLENGQLPDPN